MADWKAVVERIKDPTHFKAYLQANTRRNLRMIPLLFFAASLFHTYLLAFRYDGFNLQRGAHAIGQGNYFLGTVEWFLVPFLAFFGMGFVRTAGTALVMGQLKRIPSGLTIAAKEVQAHAVERPFQEWALIYVGGISLIAQYFRQPYGTSTGLLFLALVALAAAALAIQLLPPSKARVPVRQQVWFIALCAALGLGLGSTAYGGLGLFMVGFGVFLKWRRTSGKPPHPGEKICVWMLFGIAGWLLSQELLWADDGGWVEFKSDNPDKALWDWAVDEGGRKVIAHGAAGGAVATAGGLAGDYAGTTAGRMTKGGGGWVQPR